MRPGFESFVGCHGIAIRHGLTIGGLALLYQADLDAAGTPVDVEVLPSPNMPTVDTAVVYPGQCLVEGANLSEGRARPGRSSCAAGPGSTRWIWRRG